MEALEQAKMIYSVCVAVAKSEGTITYREVLDRLGYGEKASGHAIRYGLELVWIACSHHNLPSLTSIVVNKKTGAPSEGYAVENWKRDAGDVFAYENWPTSDSIDWEHVWEHRASLSDQYGTRGYWS